MQRDGKINKAHIIEHFMLDEFEKIPKGRVSDFISEVKTIEDHKVLDLWAEHFRGKFQGVQTRFKCPFVITKNPITGVKALWKEKVT